MLQNYWIILRQFLLTREFFNQNLLFKRSLRSLRASKPIQQTENENVNIVEDDSNYNYLGIKEEDFSIINGTYVFNSHQEHLEELSLKYEPLLHPNKKQPISIRKKIGILNIRFDSDNQPRYHGEFEKTDELVYKNFEDVVKHIQSHPTEFKKIQENQEIYEKNKPDFTVDEVIEQKPSKSQPKSLIYDKIQFRYARIFMDNDEPLKKPKDESNEDWISYEMSKREPKLPKEKKELSLSEKIANVKLDEDVKISNKTETISGIDYLKQIRSGKITAYFQDEFDDLKKLIPKEKLDSKGYRILSTQVPDFSKLSNVEIMIMIKKQILFNDADIVAINKPYGIAVHGVYDSKTNINISKNNVNSFNGTIHLGYFLKELANIVGCSKLYTVHRLDRDTTGVLLMAKTQEKAQQLNELFKNQKIKKKYFCITKNTPDNPEGIIDIPIELGFIKSPNGKKRERMVLCPEPLEEIRIKRQWRNAKKAVTYYKIKSNHGNASLLEVIPETGVRHQIRVHLGFGLRCPILGDHKYSNLDKLSPQKLPTDILMALRVRQAKTRNIPMHLHSYLMIIPEMGKNGQNIFIRAPLPFHFKKNMHSLKLKLN